jgi:predicted DNA-binding transcriptional regulator YafY
MYTTPRRTDLEAALCRAIRARKVVKLRYSDTIGNRTFEPYVVYRSSPTKILVRGKQTKDDSDPLKASGWRDFEVGRITSLVLLDETFENERQFSSFTAEIGMNVICAIDRPQIF